MKKSNILIAVFAGVVTITSYAKAEEVKISFDGEGPQNVSLRTIMRDLPNFEPTSPVPVATVNAAISDESFYKLGKSERKSLRQTMQDTKPLMFDQKVLSLINDEKTDILYNNKNVFFVTAIDENRYNTLLESGDSRLIRLLLALNNQAMPQTKQLLQPVTVCALVEVIGGAYIMKKVGEIWTQVWVETKKLVNQCHTEYVEVPDNGGSGSTYHNGQGGNSNYDVNKHLK